MTKIVYVDDGVLDNLSSENCKVTTERLDDKHWIVQIYEPDGSVVSLDFFTWCNPIVSTERAAELLRAPAEPEQNERWDCPNGDADHIMATYKSCPRCGTARSNRSGRG